MISVVNDGGTKICLNHILLYKNCSEEKHHWCDFDVTELAGKIQMRKLKFEEHGNIMKFQIQVKF